MTCGGDNGQYWPPCEHCGSEQGPVIGACGCQFTRPFSQEEKLPGDDQYAWVTLLLILIVPTVLILGGMYLLFS